VALDSNSVRWSLRAFGYTDASITAAWPEWWSSEAEGSAAAQTELRFSLARKLGLDPRTLADDQPKFVWKDYARFKHLTAESARELGVLSSYGVSVARMLSSGVGPLGPLDKASAADLRAGILATQPFVTLRDLLGLSWAMRLPVIHLRIFPLPAKRMCAMSVRLPRAAAILLGKDADYPAPIAYYLAHEIGHLALGHLGSDIAAIVDFEVPMETRGANDDEEVAADRFALELLTGRPDTTVATVTRQYTSRQLAEAVLQAGPALKIEPGTLALCFGYNMNDWPRAMAAMKYIYSAPQPVWAEVNAVAQQQLAWTEMTGDAGQFLRNVITEAPK
jgi:hypothetical protein